jgi:hypothetical protein
MAATRAGARGLRARPDDDEESRPAGVSDPPPKGGAAATAKRTSAASTPTPKAAGSTPKPGAKAGVAASAPVSAADADPESITAEFLSEFNAKRQEIEKCIESVK